MLPEAPSDETRSTPPDSRGIGLEWVYVPAGPFHMGSARERDRRTWGNEEPQHVVFLPEFWLSRFTITNRQYREFLSVTGHRHPAQWNDLEFPEGKEMHPVVGVDWYDSNAFATWVGGRLPTEAEWEKAARGTDGRIYPWGDARPTKKLCSHNFFFPSTLPVGSHPDGASPYGAMDMAGNVWEWTASKPGAYPYQSDDGRESPEGEGYRVLRGGAFRTVNPPRCAFRDVGTPATQHAIFRGIRVAFS